MGVGSREDCLLDFRDVSKVFDGPEVQRVQALRDITFGIKPNEFVSIIGASGCGKTTILRIAAGLEFPSTGSASFRGTAITGPDKRRGLVFQSYGVFPWLTVRENIAFGVTHADGPSRVDAWLDSIGLMQFAAAYPKALSGGMRQRVALARALIVEPELVCLDEPLAALDERTRLVVRGLISDLVVRSQCGALLVTHDIRDALLLSDRVIVLSTRPGRVHESHVIPGARPRSEEFAQSKEFLGLHAHLVNTFPA